jgi:hypothetical protein
MFEVRYSLVFGAYHQKEKIPNLVLLQPGGIHKLGWAKKFNLNSFNQLAYTEWIS